jgi:hypothetical protein
MLGNMYSDFRLALSLLEGSSDLMYLRPIVLDKEEEW